MSSNASCGTQSKKSRWRAGRVWQSPEPSIEDRDSHNLQVMPTPSNQAMPSPSNQGSSVADFGNPEAGLHQVDVYPSELLVSLVEQNRHRVVNLRRDPYDIYVGRDWAGKPADAGDCYWGNPFSRFQEPDLKARTSLYINWLFENHVMIARARTELSGKVLGCGCVPKYCHGWVLAAVANCSDKEADLLCAPCASDSGSPFSAAVEHLCVDDSSEGHGEGKGKKKGRGKGHGRCHGEGRGKGKGHL